MKTMVYTKTMHLRFFLLSHVLIWISFLPSTGHAAQYSYNDDASQVMFDLKHLGIVTASGEFESFEGSFHFDPKSIEDSSVRLKISTQSVASGLDKRDETLRSRDFFWSKKFPYITFESVAIKNVQGAEFMIYGNLTIRDVTRPVIFETRLLSEPESLNEGDPVSFYTQTFIKRKDFNLGTGSWTDPVLWITDEQLKISLNVEGVPAGV